MFSPCRNALLGLASALILTGCEREERRFRGVPPGGSTASTLRVSDLTPGPRSPDPAVANFYEENAYAIAQGMRLFGYFNCVGCHAHGGGGMGPPLMDERWIYGSQPENIFATIVQGRPNGMPSFAGRIPDDQVWMLVAYVRSLSGLTPKGASPGRPDHMQYKIPPLRRQFEETPRQSVKPRQ